MIVNESCVQVYLYFMFLLQPRYDMVPFLEALQEYKGILDVFPDILSVHKVWFSSFLYSQLRFNI